MKSLLIATSNEGKVLEIESALGVVPGWRFETLPPNTPDVEESGSTFMENAALKAEHYSDGTDMLTLADDSGLCVEALNGRPGVHSARYASSVKARLERLLGEMESVPDDRRGATFYCALAVARRGKVIWTVEGNVSGRIARAPSGVEGFGYDPVFVLPELNQTMAQLTTEEKNRLSARGKALAELRRFLLSA